MDFFDEIYEQKQDFPKIHSVKKEVQSYPLNFYQIFFIILFVILFFLGIIFGNLFATCQTSSYFYSDTCLVTEFNFSLMIAIWFVGVLISVFFFFIGHIISLLTTISKKVS